MYRFVLFFLGLLFCLSANAVDVVRITNGEWPPYMSENLPGYGKVTQIATEAFQGAGVNAEYTFFTTWARAFVEAEKGERWSGSLGWSKNSEREANFLYSDPIMTLYDTFFHLKSTSFDWNTMQDISDKRIGLTRGYYYGELVSTAEKNGILNADYTGKEVNNFKKLLRGRVDAVGATTDVGYALIESNFTEAEAALITHHPKPFRSSAYHLIISRNAKDAEKIIEAFNAGLKELRDNGRYDEIFNRRN